MIVPAVGHSHNAKPSKSTLFTSSISRSCSINLANASNSVLLLSDSVESFAVPSSSRLSDILDRCDCVFRALSGAESWPARLAAELIGGIASSTEAERK